MLINNFSNKIEIDDNGKNIMMIEISPIIVARNNRDVFAFLFKRCLVVSNNIKSNRKFTKSRTSIYIFNFLTKIIIKKKKT